MTEEEYRMRALADAKKAAVPPAEPEPPILCSVQSRTAYPSCGLTELRMRVRDPLSASDDTGELIHVRMTAGQMLDLARELVGAAKDAIERQIRT